MRTRRARAERFKAHLGELIDPKIGEYHGRVVKTTDDGVLAEFVSVVDAVRCAGEIQRAMARTWASGASRTSYDRFGSTRCPLKA